MCRPVFSAGLIAHCLANSFSSARFPASVY
jgi:hypothetical protein